MESLKDSQSRCQCSRDRQTVKQSAQQVRSGERKREENVNFKSSMLNLSIERNDQTTNNRTRKPTFRFKSVLFSTNNRRGN